MRLHIQINNAAPVANLVARASAGRHVPDTSCGELGRVFRGRLENTTISKWPTQVVDDEIIP